MKVVLPSWPNGVKLGHLLGIGVVEIRIVGPVPSVASIPGLRFLRKLTAWASSPPAGPLEEFTKPFTLPGPVGPGNAAKGVPAAGALIWMLPSSVV